jgi:uncharacterized protein (UPF0332 family)
MPSEDQKTLSSYRLERAYELLDEADLLFASGKYKSSNNRAYYAAFNAIRALLALEGVDFKKHSGVIQHFQKNYIKTEIFPVELSDIIVSASMVRNNSDYDDFYIASRELTKKQIEDCKTLCAEIETYIVKG